MSQDALSSWDRFRLWCDRHFDPELAQFPVPRPLRPLGDLEPPWAAPQLFAAYPDVTEAEEYIEQLRARVRELFGTGVVDEGTPDILNGHMEAMRKLWDINDQEELLERHWVLDVELNGVAAGVRTRTLLMLRDALENNERVLRECAQEAT